MLSECLHHKQGNRSGEYDEITNDYFSRYFELFTKNVMTTRVKKYYLINPKRILADFLRSKFIRYLLLCSEK